MNESGWNYTAVQIHLHWIFTISFPIVLNDLIFYLPQKEELCLSFSTYVTVRESIGSRILLKSVMLLENAINLKRFNLLIFAM